jgi:hypothetical protein
LPRADGESDDDYFTFSPRLEVLGAPILRIPAQSRDAYRQIWVTAHCLKNQTEDLRLFARRGRTFEISRFLEIIGKRE